MKEELTELVTATKRLESDVAAVIQKTEEATKETKAELVASQTTLKASIEELRGKVIDAVKSGDTQNETVQKAIARLEDLEKRLGRLAGTPAAQEVAVQKSVGERLGDWMRENSAFVADAMRSGNRVRQSGSVSLEPGAFHRQAQALSVLKANGVAPNAETIQKALALSDATNFAPVFRAPDLPLLSRGRLAMRSLLNSRTINVNAYEYLEYVGAGEYTALSLSGVTSSTTTATATSAAAHNLRVGDYVQVLGASETEYNGTFRVRSVPTTTTFTYLMSADPSGSSATGTMTYRHLSRFGAAKTVSEGSTKNQFKVVPTLKTGNCQVIAHYIKVTRQALDDVIGLQNVVNTIGVQGVAETEDDQFLYGDGSSPNLQGILTLGTIQSRTQATASSLGLLTAYRQCMTDISLVGGQASGIVVNPINREAIDLAAGLDGQFMLVGGANSSQGQLWTVPIIETKRIAPGTALVGDFAMGATIYDRQATNISFADQNEDDFLNNLVAIRFEERVGLAIDRPEMFVALTLL